MSTNLKRVLKLFLPLLLGLALVWYSLSKISVEQLLFYFKKADYFWIILGLCFGLLSHLSRAYRWKYLLQPLGYQPKLLNSVMAVFAAYLVNYTIPRAGEITRATILTNYEKVPFEKGFGTIVSERVADMVVMLGIIAAALIFKFDFIYAFLMSKFQPLKIIVALIALLLVVIGVFLYLRKSNSKIALKVRQFVGGLMQGIMSIFKMKQKWAFMFHTLFIWAMYMAMFYVTSFAIAPLQPVPFSAILIGFIFASFSIAATNGGVGSYPEAVVLAFLLFALPEEPSRAFGWIMWASQTLMIIILGGLSLIYLPIFNKKRIIP